MKHIIWAVCAVLLLLGLCTATQAATSATCSNPTYGNVYCNPGSPAPVPHRR